MRLSASTYKVLRRWKEQLFTPLCLSVKRAQICTKKRPPEPLSCYSNEEKTQRPHKSILWGSPWGGEHCREQDLWALEPRDSLLLYFLYLSSWTLAALISQDKWNDQVKGSGGDFFSPRNGRRRPRELEQTCGKPSPSCWSPLEMGEQTYSKGWHLGFSA